MIDSRHAHKKNKTKIPYFVCRTNLCFTEKLNPFSLETVLDNDGARC